MKSHVVFAIFAVLAALYVMRFVQQPGYTDAFYHFNAGARLVEGRGLTDEYLWTYIAAPDSLPAPSHLYWMPMTSLTAALGMALLNAPGSYAAAQMPFALMLAGTGLVGYWLGRRFGGTRRHAWIAGLLTLFNGMYTRYWGATDTFAPYALFGSLCLAALGMGVTTANARRALGWYAAAGVLSALAHLTRADGVLLLMVGWAAVLWGLWRRGEGRVSTRVLAVVVMTLAYTAVMLPWFARNMALVGSPLSVGGAQGVWFTVYDDLFSYPPDASAAQFFADGNGFGRLISTRWEAFASNLGTFVAVEGMIVLTPLMLVGLWMRRRDGFVRGFWLYALGVHLVMTLVFALPGYRGGLLHSAAALVPWWAALGVVGLDDVTYWMATRRRTWRAGTAKVFFGMALVVFAVYFSLFMGTRYRVTAGTPGVYMALDAALPDDARVMINDPAQLYYFTGRGGVPLPNEPPDVIQQIARVYDVDYLVLEGERGTPLPLWSLYQTLPEFLVPVPLDTSEMTLYAITR